MSLFYRMRYLCYRMRVRCGTHTCFIGEQTSCNTFGDGKLNGCAHCSAGDGSRCERAYKDLIEGQRDISPVIEDYDQRSQDIKSRHERHHGLCYFRDTLHTAGEDKYGKYCHDQSHDPLRDSKCSMERCSDGVGLYCVPHESKSKDQKYRKDTCQDLAESSLERAADIVYRSTGYDPVVSDLLISLCHQSLGINGSHSQEGSNPHPEDRARSADGDGCSRAGNITGTNLCRNGGCQSLERTHTVISGLALLAEQSAEHLLDAPLKSANLDKSRADAEPDTGCCKSNDQYNVRHVVLDRQYDVV